MCLGIPAKIVAIGDDGRNEVEVGGVTREVNLTLVPDAKLGDYVLIHIGFAIETIDEAEALNTLDLLQQIAAAVDAAS